MFIPDPILLIKIIRAVTDYRYRCKLICLYSPYFSTRSSRVTKKFFLDGKVSVLIHNYFCDVYVSTHWVIVFKRIDLAIEFNFCFKTFTSSTSKLMYKKFINTWHHF